MMNNLNDLLSLNNACLANKNIIFDVLDFEPKEHHSPSFLKIMQWLKQSVRMQQCIDQSQVETYIQTDLGVCVLIMKAWITKESCIISDAKRTKRN